MNMNSPLPPIKARLQEPYRHSANLIESLTEPTRPARETEIEYNTIDMWDALERVGPDAQSQSRCAQSLVDHHRDHPTSKAFDLLRTRVVQALRQHRWTRVAIVAPTSGCGATFTAVNLALSLARIPGSRSALIDLDQRKPGVADALGYTGEWAIEDFLSGRCLMEEHMIRYSETLALGLNTTKNPNSSEQLHDDVTAAVLEDMEAEVSPDVVLHNLPAMLEYDDLAAFLPRVDAVLLVSDGTQTTQSQIEECERIIDGQAHLLGVVLNRGRDVNA